MTMTTLICRIGVNSRDCKPMTRAQLCPGGITTTSPLFSSSIQLAILQILSTACRHVHHGRELPLLCDSTCSLCVSVKWRRKSRGWRREGIAVPGPPPSQPPPPGATTSIVVVGLVSIRNDEDSADLTKSFQELSRRLPVLVNSGLPIRELQLASGLPRKSPPFSSSFFFF